MTTDLLALLRTNPFLTGIGADAIDRLIAAGQLRPCNPEEVLFASGDLSTSVFFLLKGTIRILSRDQGRPVPLADLAPGEIFGELAAIDGLQRTGDAVAIDAVEVFECPREAFLALIVENAPLGLRLLERFSAVIRRADTRISALSNLSPGQRVFFALLNLATPDTAGSGTWTISPAPPHREVAGWAGTTEEVVAGAVAQLMRNGLLRRRNMDLQIFDRSKIEALIQQS
ncbi:Crp/Fnr family transcriptional regulator [Lacibacterium aquatile]|uniref:Crp/Fnr family transcriptional regulator n=1 Tax=Lacibacterium aquatile TaxID=1168082 RepID=A0ABW5DRM5_9PROT